MTEPTDNTPEPTPEPEDDGIAAVGIYLGQRLMLLCHKHARALIDLADGNGVRLRIEPLAIEDFGQECRACLAAAVNSDDSGPKIILM